MDIKTISKSKPYPGFNNGQGYDSMPGVTEEFLEEQKKDERLYKFETFSSDYARALEETIVQLYNERYYLLTYGANEEQLEEINYEINVLEQELCSTVLRITDPNLMKPYQSILVSQEYEDFKRNYNPEYNVDISGTIREINEKYGQSGTSIIYDHLKNKYPDKEIDKLAIIEYLIETWNDDVVPIETLMASIDISYMYFDYYLYMSEEQKMMYHYIFDSYGEEEAQRFMTAIKRSINEAKGTEDAINFLNSLDWSDPESVSNTINTYFEGVGDGIPAFFEGLKHADIDTTVLSANEYEMLIILTELSKKSDWLKEVYGVGVGTGEAIIPFVANAYISYLTKNPILGKEVSLTLSTVSKYGNQRHYELVQGMSELEAYREAISAAQNHFERKATFQIPLMGLRSFLK